MSIVKMKHLHVACIILIICGVIGSIRKTKPGYGFGEQDYGYFEVRKGAHMFWWIQYVLNTTKVEDAALVLWIAGGPGIGSTGLGNLGSTGPTTQQGQYRKGNWAEKYNLLFIDSPVGSGYSYADDPDLYNGNDISIAIDLYKTFKHVLTEHPEFKNTPVYAYSNSFGAMVCLEFGKYLHDMIRSKDIDCNLKGLILAHGVINATGMVSRTGIQTYIWAASDLVLKNELDRNASRLTTFLKQGLVYEAGDINVRLSKVLFNDGEQLIHKVKKNNTIITVIPHSDKMNPFMDYNPIQAYTLRVTMNGAVKTVLNIPENVSWETRYHELYYKLSNAVSTKEHLVQYLLQTTDLKIFVCAGGADGVISPISTENWVKSIDWPGKSNYTKTRREMIWNDGVLEGYKKVASQFGFFWLLSTGHLGFYDSPNGTMNALTTMIGY